MSIPSPANSAKTASNAFSTYQKLVAVTLAFLQFTILLDFMLLAPLGAIVIPALKITLSQFGFLVSAYAFSAGASGILAARFADSFDRKTLLLFFYVGFLAGTLLCGLASSYHALLLARMISGMFAGVVSSASMAIVTDLFPLELRGRAMGTIQTAFAASSVLGIPLALLLSSHGGWNTPFFMIAGVGAVVGGLIYVYLDRVDGHLQQHADRNPLDHVIQTISNRHYMLGFVTTVLLGLGSYVLLPFMNVFMVHNLGLPIRNLPLVYTITGASFIVTAPLTGRASDLLGKFKVCSVGSVITILMELIYTHLHSPTLWLLIVVMILLQIGISSWLISAFALMSALPKPADRGSYMSISSSLQQMSGGIAAVIAMPDHRANP